MDAIFVASYWYEASYKRQNPSSLAPKKHPMSYYIGIFTEKQYAYVRILIVTYQRLLQNVYISGYDPVIAERLRVTALMHWGIACVSEPGGLV